MEMILALCESDGPLDVHFRRPGELDVAPGGAGGGLRHPLLAATADPAQGGPEPLPVPHPAGAASTATMTALLALLVEEFEGREVRVHFGWPTSSWLDRMATGVFVWNLLRLPKLFPTLALRDRVPGSGGTGGERRTPRLGVDPRVARSIRCVLQPAALHFAGCSRRITRNAAHTRGSGAGMRPASEALGPLGQLGPSLLVRSHPAQAEAMSTAVLLGLNIGLGVLFATLVLRPRLLGFATGGKWYLTWLAIGVITLMDELTSIFYAPAEAHRFIGSHAIFFIVVTSLLMRILSSAHGGDRADPRAATASAAAASTRSPTSCSGPVASFVAVASIMVDYILTACISTVSAVINGTAFLPIGRAPSRLLMLAIIWGVALAEHPRHPRERARDLRIFIAAAFVFVNLIVLGVLDMDPRSPGVILESARRRLRQRRRAAASRTSVAVITVGVASCVLAYSGIESVIQTAGLVQGWRDIAKAYWFLALTVGIVTPVVSALALSAPIDLKAHEGDLITALRDASSANVPSASWWASSAASS